MFSTATLKLYSRINNYLTITTWLQRILVFTCLAIAGALSDNNGVTDASEQWLNAALLFFIVGRIVRSGLDGWRRHILWKDFTSKHPHAARPLPSPILNAGPGSIQSRPHRISVGGHEATIAHATVNYHPKKGKTDDMLGFALDYLVLAIPLNKTVPHIFIDGRRQNRFTPRNTNLWSLVKRVARQQKMQALEGDFYKYFDVYAADQKQIETLSILTPDTMLALRDNGFEFDYELHDRTLYVISEPNLDSPQAYEAYIRAAETVLTELIPQISKRYYAENQPHLRITGLRMAAWAWLLSLVVIFKWLFIIALTWYLCFTTGSFLMDVMASTF